MDPRSFIRGSKLTPANANVAIVDKCVRTPLANKAFLGLAPYD